MSTYPIRFHDGIVDYGTSPGEAGRDDYTGAFRDEYNTHRGSAPVASPSDEAYAAGVSQGIESALSKLITDELEEAMADSEPAAERFMDGIMVHDADILDSFRAGFIVGWEETQELDARTRRR